MPLHLPTLLFLAALVIAFTGGLLMFAPGPRRDAGAIGLWGGAMLLGALGMVLAAAGPGLALLSNGLSTALFLAATGVSWTAARAFAEHPPRPWVAGAGAALWLLLVPIRQAYPGGGWVALSCGVGVAYTLAAAAELRPTGSERLPSRGAALTLLLAHAAVYAARCGDALLGDDAEKWSAAIGAAMLVEALLHTVGMAFLLLSLVKERIELRSREHMRALALKDGLTGIANRRRFDEQLAAEVRRSQRSGAPVALLMIDVDHFKRFNDTFGHPKGDACLRAVAGALAGLVHRPGDLVARYGGEEFAVLLPGTGLPGAAQVGEALRGAVMALGLPHSEPGSVVTISVGAAVSQPGRITDPAAALVQAADRALYAAKAGGRNRVARQDLVPA